MVLLHQLSRKRNKLIKGVAAFALYLAVGCSSETDVQIIRLGDTRPEVRLIAAERLGNMEKGAASATPLLIKLLGDPSGSVRVQVIQALNQIGSPGHQQLLQSLKDPNDQIRSGAVQALGQPDPRIKRGFTVNDDKGTYPIVIKMVAEDKDIGVRISAIKSLVPISRGAQEQHGALDELVRQLSATENSIKIAAATSIGFLVRGTTDGREIEKLPRHLIMLLASDDISVKRGALWALAEFGENLKDECVMIVPLLKDQDEQVQNDAYEALRRTGSARQHAIPHLKAMLMDENLDPHTRRAANLLLEMSRAN